MTFDVLETSAVLSDGQMVLQVRFASAVLRALQTRWLFLQLPDD